MDEGGIDWGQAEALAFASLLVEGIPIRALGPGHRARHVLAPPRSSCTTSARARRTRRSRRSARRRRVVRDLQLAALGVRLPRLRVRLLGRRAGGARALGGAVRRLRQRRADRDRPVPRRRALEVGADVAADAAPAARLRGQRPRALERPARALPPARRPGEHPRRERARPRRSTSTCCAARRSTRRRGRSS